jgi:AraC-like DNA-binding protein
MNHVTVEPLGLTVRMLLPPYATAHAYDAAAPAWQCRGAILLWDVPPLPSAGDDDLAFIGLRRRHPAATLVVRLPQVMTGPALRVAGRAMRAGIRVVPSDCASSEQLRENLTCDDVIADDLCAWLYEIGAIRNHAMLDFLRDVTLAYAHRGARESHPNWPRSVRNLCAAQCLPPPLKWRVFVRRLCQLVRVQSEPARPIASIAGEIGFADQQEMCRVFRASFGATPRQVRACIGWHWACWYWLRLHLSVFDTGRAGNDQEI